MPETNVPIRAVIVLEEGRITEEWTLQELLSKKGAFHAFREQQRF